MDNWQTNNRITKSLDELEEMTKEDLVSYFQETACSKKELIEFLGAIGFSTRTQSRQAIIEYAATQIQNLGIFKRISKPNKRR